MSFRGPFRSYYSFPFLPSPIVVSRFSASRLHFPHISTRPPPNEATPVLDQFCRPEKKQVSNNVRADGTWSLCPRRVSPPSCMSMSTVVTKTIDSVFDLGLSRCVTLQTPMLCVARFERRSSSPISMHFSSVCFTCSLCCSFVVIFFFAYSAHDSIWSHDFDVHVCFDMLFMKCNFNRGVHMEIEADAGHSSHVDHCSRCF